jgi:hypothetical protein
MYEGGWAVFLPKHTGKASIGMRRIIVILSEASECQHLAARDAQPGGPLYSEQLPLSIDLFSRSPVDQLGIG